MKGDGLVNGVVGFNAPYHVCSVLRNPTTEPVCECGKPATVLVRFVVLNGEGHSLLNGLLVCAECATEMTIDNNRATIEPIDELQEKLRQQTLEYLAKDAARRGGKQKRAYRSRQKTGA